MNAGDVRRVKHVLQQKGRSWSHMRAFNFACIAPVCLGCADYRCYPTLAIGATRLHIPSPMVLYHRVKAVFDFFIDKKDTLTGKPLFHAEAKKAAQRVLAAIRRGEFSYAPGVDFYVRKTDRYGREMVDSDGLWLYRSIRGTSNLESLHQSSRRRRLLETRGWGHSSVDDDESMGMEVEWKWTQHWRTRNSWTKILVSSKTARTAPDLEYL
jgi:hypothetical protein